MQLKTGWIVSLAALVVLMGGGLAAVPAQIPPGKRAPSFALKSVEGASHALDAVKDHPMVILYFFDVESRPSQEGLLTLDRLTRQHREARLTVWGITLSPAQKVAEFAAGRGLGFPLLPDTSGVSDLYHARVVLPTVYILGPQLKVLDYFQGGGRTTEVMLTRLAERTLQARQPALARALGGEAGAKDPANTDARVVQGYAALKEGKLEEAAETFDGLAQKTGRAGAVGKEGLAAVYARQGQAEKALQLADEVTQKAPGRAYPHVIKGDVLYSQGRHAEAEKEYQEATRKEEAPPFQRAVAHNRLGRLNAAQARYPQARELYDQAVELDPYYVEATANKGVTYEREGQWGKALEAYKGALTLDQSDVFTAVLARKAQERLDLERDAARSRRVDALVKELAERYRQQKAAPVEEVDAWTSRPMVLSFVDMQERGGLADRDGFPIVLAEGLTEQLNRSGRVRVIERVLIERVLEELNLGSSELADPETASRLGRIMAVKLIGTGTLNHLPGASLLNLRLIDTETTAIPRILTAEVQPGPAFQKTFFQLSRQILETVMEKYPLRGYVVEAAGDEVMINLGAQQGVVLGTRFAAVEEQPPVEYKGRLLQRAQRTIGELEVTRIEPDLAYARVLEQDRPLKTDDKVQETGGPARETR
ncbi:tetratricopeptide repeat protein [Desulfatiglans anilini]|uniref:tetratricopeptide repeat protein n=1 Tax=Desulfatiglans anilini TaxID=90728 RepID=UPI00041A8E49|nr:tetratricopeptide repeat protein [Desulfatiglans anilini]